VVEEESGGHLDSRLVQALLRILDHQGPEVELTAEHAVRSRARESAIGNYT
jgi:HD-GYP domain-containing protein (c-di-GMP phosphodiesterase class II)